MVKKCCKDCMTAYCPECGEPVNCPIRSLLRHLKQRSKAVDDRHLSLQGLLREWEAMSLDQFKKEVVNVGVGGDKAYFADRKKGLRGRCDKAAETARKWNSWFHAVEGLVIAKDTLKSIVE